MRNLRVRLAYDGSRFFGWQRQDGFESVQEALEDAITAVTGERATVYGAGRTDTGVHALGQVASFHADTRLDDERLLFALNAHLPEGVAIDALETCPDGFHAQFDAIGKRYLYLVLCGRFRPPFARELAHWVRAVPELGAMRSAARHMVGERDFGALANAGSPRRSNVRRLSAVHVLRRRRALAIVVQADGFLYNMARTIAGTLLEVGRGRIDPEAIPALLEAGRREALGPTAPARGLYLLSVRYREPCFAELRPRARSVPV